MITATKMGYSTKRAKKHVSEIFNSIALENDLSFTAIILTLKTVDLIQGLGEFSIE